MVESLRSQRLIALFFAGAALFNFPLLALWDRDVLSSACRCSLRRCSCCGHSSSWRWPSSSKSAGEEP